MPTFVCPCFCSKTLANERQASQCSRPTDALCMLKFVRKSQVRLLYPNKLVLMKRSHEEVLLSSGTAPDIFSYNYIYAGHPVFPPIILHNITYSGELNSICAASVNMRNHANNAWFQNLYCVLCLLYILNSVCLFEILVAQPRPLIIL